MKWIDFFNTLNFFLENALGKDIEIESFFGKRVFRISDPDKAEDILFIVYNIQTRECGVLRGKDFIVVPVPVKDLRLFSEMPAQEKRPERFIEDFLCLLKIEERRGEERDGGNEMY